MKILNKLAVFVSFIFLLIFWQLLVQINHYPEFILPAPKLVAIRLIEALVNGSLIFHAFITLKEIVLGLVIGFSLAFLLGYVIAKLKYAENFITPVIISLQTIPVLAIAPLLVIWFGTGILAKALVASSTLFFPVLINTLTGFKQLDQSLIDLFKSYRANWWQKLKWLELPASLPIFLAGLKIGVTLSVIGAVVGEFVSADKGLGYLINLAGGLYDTPLRFVAFIALSFLALFLYGLVSLLEKSLIKWRS